MYLRIVVGTDGSERAGAAVEHAAELASAVGASLHVVQGCGTPVVVAPMLGDAVGVDQREVVSACEQALQPLHESLIDRGIDSHVHVVPEGGPAALCDIATHVNADLIVVGNRGMTGARRVLGSVPNTVAHHAPCSVLIVTTG